MVVATMGAHQDTVARECDSDAEVVAFAWVSRNDLLLLRPRTIVQQEEVDSASAIPRNGIDDTRGSNHHRVVGHRKAGAEVRVQGNVCRQFDGLAPCDKGPSKHIYSSSPGRTGIVLQRPD
jgi:hypothetical protein